MFSREIASSKSSQSSRFQRPFIKPMPPNVENKENLTGININRRAPLPKKQVFCSENRKFSLTPHETNELLSPGHFPSASHKELSSFKSPQRQTPVLFNVKASGFITTSSRSPTNGKPDKQTKRISEEKENIFEKMKAFSSDFVLSTKAFINNKINRLSAREKCACEAGLTRNATCSKAFQWLFKRYKKKDLEYLKNTYENLKKKPLVEESVLKQIERDILRTFPNCQLFKENHEGCKVLQDVLVTFASYDPQIGYVQGMNYIVGFFLFHAEEFIAFWLLVLMFELFELRDVYLPNLPGLSKHLQIIDILVLTHAPDLYNHMISQAIKTEMYCSPWIFSLFGMVIPLEEMSFFYDEFLEKGWTFFYHLVLNHLIKEKKELIQQDCMGILQILTQNNYKFLKKEDYERNCGYWRGLLRLTSTSSEKKPINSQLISKLHTNYDPESKTFKLLPYK